MSSLGNYRKYLQPAYFFGLLMMAVGLTLSPFLMSLAQFWLVGIWIIDGAVNKDFKEKWQRFSHNWVALLLVSLYLLHVVGLIYTSDFQYAFKDLRIKLPLLILPFVLSSMRPLCKKQFDLLLNVYVFSVFVAFFLLLFVSGEGVFNIFGFAAVKVFLPFLKKNRERSKMTYYEYCQSKSETKNKVSLHYLWIIGAAFLAFGGVFALLCETVPAV